MQETYKRNYTASIFGQLYNKYIWQSMTYWWMDEIEILSSVDSLTFSINIGDILRMIYCIYDFLSPMEDNKRSYDQVNGVDLENLHYRNPDKP